MELTQLQYSTRYISGPTTEPVSLAEIYAALAIDSDNTAFNSTDLLAKARAARVEAEGYLGKLIGPQVWDIITDFWPGNWLLPLEPVTAINGIYWIDSDGNENPVDTTIYTYSPPMNRLWLKPGSFWPDSFLADYGAIRINVTAGAPLDKVLDNVKQAILFRTGTFANIREDMTVGTVLQAAKVGTFEALLGVNRNITI